MAEDEAPQQAPRRARAAAVQQPEAATPPAEASDVAPVQQQQGDEIPRERVLGESDAFFDQPQHVVAGALAVLGEEREAYSKQEVSDAINAYLTHEEAHEEA